MKIGSSFITFTYGMEKEFKRTRINYSIIGADELERIVDKFQYETGIKPTIIN